jgi:hypothetical protein
VMWIREYSRRSAFAFGRAELCTAGDDVFSQKHAAFGASWVLHSAPGAQQPQVVAPPCFQFCAPTGGSHFLAQNCPILHCARRRAIENCRPYAACGRAKLDEFTFDSSTRAQSRPTLTAESLFPIFKEQAILAVCERNQRGTSITD